MKKHLHTAADWLVYLLVRIVICIVQAMPIERCQMLARWTAMLAWDVLRIRRTVILDNLAHAYPQWTESQRFDVAREMWEHLFLMVFEIAHVPRKLHQSNWRQHVTVPEECRLVALMLDPRPLVLVSGHFGNFEVASYLCGLWGFPSYTIARELDNPFLHRFVTRFRQATGQVVLPKHGSAGEVANVLNSGGTLALLGDQDAGPKGCWSSFLGRPASYHKAVALFSLTTGAPLAVVCVKRTKGPLQFEMGIGGVADPLQQSPETANVTALTDWYSGHLEHSVRQSPRQYWWVHRRWKSTPRKRLQNRHLSGPHLTAKQKQGNS